MGTRKAGRPDAHVIEILTEQTNPAYKAYLRQRGVSYILEVCGSNNNMVETTSSADEIETVTETPQTEKSSENESEEQEITETDVNDGNVLVAYFSYTGNTKEVVQMIAEYTGGDLAEIERAEEYGDLQEDNCSIRSFACSVELRNLRSI